jgi:fido (protein-threonine AMPylation protein)
VDIPRSVPSPSSLNAPTYTEAEDRRLAQNLLSLVRNVSNGEHDSCNADASLVCSFHRELFTGVRDHAGRFRSSEFGTERLVFGPNRSVHRDHVPAELDAALEQVDRSIRSFKANPDAADYEKHALHVAIWAHAKTIEIHPFEDGNGRTSRVLMNWVLRQLNMRPIVVEIPRMEYNDCLNVYFKTNDFSPLFDLLLAVYVSQL